jgi:hypothetical protein
MVPATHAVLKLINYTETLEVITAKPLPWSEFTITRWSGLRRDAAINTATSASTRLPCQVESIRPV